MQQKFSALNIEGEKKPALGGRHFYMRWLLSAGSLTELYPLVRSDKLCNVDDLNA